MGRPTGTTKKGWKYLDESQLFKFFTAVKKGKNFQHELWFDLCLYFGLRVTELTHLCLDDIRPDVFGLEISGVKNGLTMTYRRIDPRLWKKLQRWLKIRATKPSASGCTYLFPSSTLYSEPISEQAVKAAFKRYLKAADIDNGFSVHSLRHSCGVLKAKNGHNPIDIKDWLRQKSLTSTLAYLQKIRFENQSAEAIRIFGSFL